MINNFVQLKVLKEAHQFTIAIYQLTKTFSKQEQYRLVDQLCRAAASVPANIVEGNSRKTKKEFVQFLYQAKGSLAETQYHLMLAKDLTIISKQAYDSLIQQSDHIGKLISGLIRYRRS